MVKATQRSVWIALATAGLLGACGGTSIVEPGDGGAAGTGGTGGTAGSGGTAGTGGTGGTGGTATACGLGSVGTQPPGPAADADDPLSGKVALVISELLLGDRGWDGSPSPSAWREFGYNLDERISTQDSNDLCQPAAGAAPSKAYPDGDGGIDNSFGKNILPIFTGLAPDLSHELNQSILAGSTTMLVEVAGLGPGPSYRDLYGTSWLGAELTGPPSFDGNDVWSPLSGSEGSFSCGYASDHTVVLALGEPMEFPFLFIDLPWPMDLHQPIVTMQLAPDHRTITRGVVAGILRTEDLVEDFRQMAGHIDSGLCEGSTFDSIADQLRQASDIMQDGSQSPAQVCNGITAGFGFRGTLVELGMPEAPPPPPPDPCL